ncbi:hypothetical protein CEXT_362491 [Caerostris extrusa]|uniref:Uncharacterized protein n=1 Tax=Caerostris extrusa TaxID=172846 RepID=A0AAV4VDM9_CAEEX|nr:hypothetical protein CEXT_362491 [Caerostris extrusa]
MTLGDVCHIHKRSSYHHCCMKIPPPTCTSEQINHMTGREDQSRCIPKGAKRCPSSHNPSDTEEQVMLQPEMLRKTVLALCRTEDVLLQRWSATLLARRGSISGSRAPHHQSFGTRALWKLRL